MTHRTHAAVAVLTASLISLMLVLAVVAERGFSDEAEQRAATSRAGAVVLKGPASAQAGATFTVQVRVKRGLRGKVALQARSGARWTNLRSRKLPRDGRVEFAITAPASGGSMSLRAKVGPRVSPTLTTSVRRRSQPSPKPTESPLPELPTPGQPSDDDPRCQAQFGTGKPVPEQEHRVRPISWPRTPASAVLCRLVHLSINQEYGCYATDPGTKLYDILWYYDHAVTAAGGVAGWVNIDGQDFLTGVQGTASFYIGQDEFDQFYIVWATDGEYDDYATIAC